MLRSLVGSEDVYKRQNYHSNLFVTYLFKSLIYYWNFSLVSVVHVKSLVKANPVTCEICEMAMQYLDSMLSNNSTEEEIKQGLDQLCAYLPESVRGEVRNLFEIYLFKESSFIVSNRKIIYSLSFIVHQPCRSIHRHNCKASSPRIKT